MIGRKKIVLLASGTGTNVQAIINHFKGTQIEPALIITNNPSAGVLSIAEKEQIPSLVMSSKELGLPENIQRLKDLGTNLIILAGYLKKIPATLVKEFEDKIINIHPALLPKYGGKGMYGIHVHEKVVEMKEIETGITIHYVNEVYDEGQILLQARCKVFGADTPKEVAQRVLKLEHYYFPRVIEFLLK